MTRGYRLTLVPAIAVVLVAASTTSALAVPVNDNFADAQEITGITAMVSGSNLDATSEPDEPSHGEFAGGHSIWFRWTAPEDMRARLDLCDSGFDSVVAVYTGTDLASLTRVARNDDSYSCRRASRSRVTLDAVAGTTYHIAVDGNFESSGAIVLKLVDLRPPNDDFSAGQPLRGYAVSVTGDNEHATIEPDEPDPFGGRLEKSLWYRWTTQSSGVVTIDTCRSNFDTLLAVYTGGDLATLEELVKDDDGCGGQSRVIFFAPGGTTVQIQVAAPGATRKLKLEIGLPRPGSYSGGTRLDRKPISFRLADTGIVVRDFTFAMELDCYQRGRWVGTFKLKDISIDKIDVGRDEDGAGFVVNAKIRFKDGGHMEIYILGSFTPPERATGRIKVRIELPDNVTCKHWLGSLRWSAHR